MSDFKQAVEAEILLLEAFGPCLPSPKVKWSFILNVEQVYLVPNEVYVEQISNQSVCLSSPNLKVKCIFTISSKVKCIFTKSQIKEYVCMFIKF